ncbi:MAG: L-threonine dehydratase catabolic TdcB [Alphaproteobacteria bacterium MarineAlpha9_Bin4]|nr:threonine ammonia-lyase [Pelagibacterales bacterium]PPR25872.1 MAG: L-threonine dehydratase catabolic TdcB [Alphaproteobacteria bacterium MarineAlpha9_Bin4]|tara:strand:+ start:977 stop:2179 length:1203 start_codon:yes stop_codon:yes gene_type:complete
MFKDIIKANQNIKKYLVRTPTRFSNSLSTLTRKNIYVKYENFQHTGSFKYRGALNKILNLTTQQRKRGVIAMSAGNHAQGVSLACKLLKNKAIIVMPNNTPFEKIRRNIELGAKVEIFGDNVLESEKYVDKLVKKFGYHKIHPFDDINVIYGQGTLMLEMLEDFPIIDTLLVPIGGGGLLSGCSIVAKHIKKNIKIIGIQTENFPSFYNSFYNTNKTFMASSVAEGIAVKKVGKLNSKILKKYVDKCVLVKEKKIEEAISHFLMRDKTLVEGAGAAGLAAILEGKITKSSKNIGLIACGGNLDSRVLSSLLMRELVRKKKILTLSIDMEDKPGQLNQISILCSQEKINILEVEHSRFTLDLSVRAARLNITLETKDEEHAKIIINKIKKLGFQVEEKKKN